jgi:hypothetical protein
MAFLPHEFSNFAERRDFFRCIMEIMMIFNLEKEGKMRPSVKFLLQWTALLALMIAAAPAGAQPGGPCDMAIPPRMQVGYQGRVVPTMNARNVRQYPDGPKTGVVMAGASFDVVDGPWSALDDEGGCYNWWRIEVHGSSVEGWVAEGVGAQYWLEPLNQPNIGLVQPSGPFTGMESFAACPGTPPARMQVGYRGQTDPYITLPTAVRSAPGSGENLQSLYAGVEFDVLGGPVCAYYKDTAYTWWFISVPDLDLQGWIAEGVTGEYWIHPLDDVNEEGVPFPSAPVLLPQPQDETFTCPGAPLPRLEVGSKGRAIDLIPTLIRPMPGGATSVGQIYANQAFTVLDGPVCASRNGVNYVWWYASVPAAGVTGWIAEGVMGQYWLEPDSAGPSLPAPDTGTTETCPGAPVPRMVVGENGLVDPTEQSETVVRSAPGGGEDIAGLVGGTLFEVLEGPVCAERYGTYYYWWKISTIPGIGGVVGWIAEGVTGDYWIEPFITKN